MKRKSAEFMLGAICKELSSLDLQSLVQGHGVMKRESLSFALSCCLRTIARNETKRNNAAKFLHKPAKSYISQSREF
jgi:hypothetical protein